MFKGICLIFCLVSLVACTRIDFRSEELQPIQSNFSDGDLKILILTESTLVSREASEKVHKREYSFPPRILVHVSTGMHYKDTSFEITSASLQTQDGVNVFVMGGASLTFRDSWYKDIEKYETYSHLKNLGGLNTVRDILITPWLNEVVLNQEYILKLSYLNFEGIEKHIEVRYKAIAETNSGFVPTKAYWNSI